MMWNWLLGGLGTGATLVLYDGSPFKPNFERLWELVDEFGITHFGISAKYIQSLEEASVKPKSKFSLKTLKAIYSTGSPLKPESYDFIYKHIKEDVCVGSITGGTDIISLFAGHNVAGPVHRGEIQCRCLVFVIYFREWRLKLGMITESMCWMPLAILYVSNRSL
jgi:acetoacetyl-CoA synthetase